jgi:hypothetical protein
MTLKIIIVLTILGLAITLFITEWVRMDVVALLVLSSLAVAGLVTPHVALSGFSNLSSRIAGFGIPGRRTWNIHSLLLAGGFGCIDICHWPVLRQPGQENDRKDWRQSGWLFHSGSIDLIVYAKPGCGGLVGTDCPEYR